MNRIRQVTFAALTALVVGGGVVVASAATLGGIGSQWLGADDGAVQSCDTNGVTVAYSYAYDNTDQRYEVTGATIGSTAATCDGMNLSVTLTGTGGASLATSTATTVASGSTGVVFASPPSAEAVIGASVLITGPAAP